MSAMSEYKICPMNTRYGVEWHVQVINCGRHTAWHVFRTQEQAQEWTAKQEGGKT